jgi:hypothetical protein
MCLKEGGVDVCRHFGRILWGRKGSCAIESPHENVPFLDAQWEFTYAIVRKGDF